MVASSAHITGGRFVTASARTLYNLTVVESLFYAVFQPQVHDHCILDQDLDEEQHDNYWRGH